eukprot:898643-Lingulodinium_polyedra.AAC.1
MAQRSLGRCSAAGASAMCLSAARSVTTGQPVGTAATPTSSAQSRSPTCYRLFRYRDVLTG